MSVNPIDLQVIFTQMNQVGKQQADIKDSEVLRQDQASHQIAKDSNKNTEDVPETKDVKEGAGKIKDKDKGKEKQEEKEGNEKNNQEEKKAEKTDKKDLKKSQDPKVGQNIDVLG